MDILKMLQKRSLLAFVAVLIVSIALAVVAYEVTLATWSHAPAQSGTAGKTTTAATTPTSIVPVTPVSSPPAATTPTFTPATPINPDTVLGIDSGPPSDYPGITWTRISYPTCGGPLSGNALKSNIQLNHLQGVHVLLLLCQQPSHLLNMGPVNDVAQSGADAVECGNEQMKHNTYSTYVSPEDFARFFDVCERTVHAVHPGIPVLLGSLDPHVGGIDYQPLLDQVGYLNEMEYAMNTFVHPGGHWHWRSQILGLIDSWHNGYPSAAVNSLRALFDFWVQQFGIAPSDLGHHLWVVEGTGCIYGCGLGSSYDISVAHVLTLITDVQTARQYHVPFFYFSGRDFYQQGQSSFWPMGILDVNGHPKPLRQDLGMGARVLTMSCPGGQVNVQDQEQLLAKMYAGCSLPGDYVSILAG